MADENSSINLNICLIVSGSIAAFKACELVSLLIKEGHRVQVIETKGARHFVGSASFEALSHRKVYTTQWASREDITHISLVKWTDLFLFYPITANRINQLAQGLAQDLTGAIFLANNFNKPFWIAPAMNTGMLLHPATQESLKTLKTWGCRIIYGESGTLACGDTGQGRLVEPAIVFKQIQTQAVKIFQKRTGLQKRVLITGGAMSEPIDSVRFINNTSTGRTASLLAHSFVHLGWSVDYLHHVSADLKGSEGSEHIEYFTFQDFENHLYGLLEKNSYDVIVHAAAVSDYRACLESNEKSIANSKLESDKDLYLTLKPNPKLLTTLRQRAKGSPLIFGFKLTVGEQVPESLLKVKKQFQKGPAGVLPVDYIIWNDLSKVSPKDHEFIIYAMGNDDRLFSVVKGSGNLQLSEEVLKISTAKD